MKSAIYSVIFIVIILLLFGSGYYFGTQSVNAISSSSDTVRIEKWDTLRFYFPPEIIEETKRDTVTVIDTVPPFLNIDTLTNDIHLIYTSKTFSGLWEGGDYKVYGTGLDFSIDSTIIHTKSVFTQVNNTKIKSSQFTLLGGVSAGSALSDFKLSLAPYVRLEYNRKRWRFEAEITAPYEPVGGEFIPSVHVKAAYRIFTF